MKRVYQTLTVTYNLRDFEMTEEQQQEWIILANEHIQKKIKSLSHLLVHKVRGIQFGHCEVEEETNE